MIAAVTIGRPPKFKKLFIHLYVIRVLLMNPSL
jgi:hypothetical protein